MRLLLTALFTLLVFTVGQTAMAFDNCCETLTKSETTAACDHAVKHDQGQKNSKKMAEHCAMSCHHAVGMFKGQTIAARNMRSAKTIFTQPIFHELLVGEGLIEPPSLS